MPKDEIEIESSEKSWHLKSGRSKIEVKIHVLEESHSVKRFYTYGLACTWQ